MALEIEVQAPAKRFGAEQRLGQIAGFRLPPGAYPLSLGLEY
jgi:hypothetical protein